MPFTSSSPIWLVRLRWSYGVIYLLELSFGIVHLAENELFGVKKCKKLKCVWEININMDLVSFLSKFYAI